MRSADQVGAMSCPVCVVPLAMSDRQGIEIDYCPQCRGVWLDRGELDKIIERSETPQAAQQSAPQSAPPPLQAPPPMQQQGYQQPVYQQPYNNRGDQGYYKHKKRKSWLEDIFD
jgi:uncharacterized protein